MDIPPRDDADPAIVSLRARHSRWEIGTDRHGRITARLGAYTVSADTIEQLERAIGDYESGRAAR